MTITFDGFHEKRARLVFLTGQYFFLSNFNIQGLQLTTVMNCSLHICHGVVLQYWRTLGLLKNQYSPILCTNILVETKGRRKGGGTGQGSRVEGHINNNNNNNN